LLSKTYPVIHPHVMDKLSEYCGRPIFQQHDNHTDVEDFEPLVWDFYNSVFFVITVVSTIGYGNLSPSSATGRMIMIVYALIGIPMNGIMLATLAEFFSTALKRVHKRYKMRHNETRTGFVADIILFLIPGFVVFIFLPTGIFMHFEGWTFDQSLYYAFVTLTTIGFGDLVAGQTDKLHDNEILFILYKVLLLIWIVFGLGYLVMILGFITRAMRSKKVARLEHKLASNLKHTQSKLWHNFTRDMSYFRRVLNELYVMKLKPVYKYEEPIDIKIRARSSSEPTLYGLPDRSDKTGPGFGVWRRRANSETAAGLRLPRVLSDSDLEKIDRDATFRAATVIEPSELLFHMVNALGAEEEGVQGFTDAEILASEEANRWTIGGEPIPKRNRAASEVRFPMKQHTMDNQWTWSGDPHQLARTRHKSLIPPTTRRPSLFQMAAARIKQPLKKRHKTKSTNDLSPELNLDSDPYMTQTSMHPALEETSLADFLRAVTSLQQTRIRSDITPRPHRKNGTSGMTPPGSLHSLFSHSDRRMSLLPTPTPSVHNASLRRSSLHPAVSRRFSVHLTNLNTPIPSSNQTPTQPVNQMPVQPLRRMAPHLFEGQSPPH
ncbi:hypothetical protein L9F63_019550, partial [Diploptera punctata]